MLETLSIAIFGTITLLLAGGMTDTLFWAAARDGETHRRAVQSIESIPAPEATLPVGAQWAVSFEE